MTNQLLTQRSLKNVLFLILSTFSRCQFLCPCSATFLRVMPKSIRYIGALAIEIVEKKHKPNLCSKKNSSIEKPHKTSGDSRTPANYCFFKLFFLYCNLFIQLSTWFNGYKKEMNLIHYCQSLFTHFISKTLVA